MSNQIIEELSSAAAAVIGCNTIAEGKEMLHAIDAMITLGAGEDAKVSARLLKAWIAYEESKVVDTPTVGDK